MVALPRLTSKQSEKVGNINFSMPVKRLRALAKGFDDINMSYREVGIRAFDYSYEDLVGDD